MNLTAPATEIGEDESRQLDRSSGTLPPMVFKRASDQQLKAFAMTKIRELISTTRSDGTKWTPTSLALALNITKARMSQLLRDDANPGPNLIARLQDLLPMDPMRFNSEALAWSARTPLGEGASPRPEPRVVKDERYPNRSKAADFARDAGISEEAIRRVMGLSLKAGEDPNPLDWLEEMQAEERRLKRGIVQRGQRPTEEDEEALRPGPPKKSR